MKKNPAILPICKKCWSTYSFPWAKDEELEEMWKNKWICPARHWNHTHIEIQGIPKYCPYFMEILVLNQGYPK